MQVEELLLVVELDELVVEELVVEVPVEMVTLDPLLPVDASPDPHPVTSAAPPADIIQPSMWRRASMRD